MSYKKPNTKKLQAQCDAFNEACPVGGRVKVELDGGEVRETVTTSEAQILSGHSAVVWLEGISGCYLLDRVTPMKALKLEPNPFTHARAALLEYDITEPARQKAWDEVDCGEDVDTAKAAELEALNKVRAAFYKDTKAYNKVEDCMLLKLDFMRRCVDGGGDTGQAG